MATAAKEVVVSEARPKRHKARTEIAAKASRENGRKGGRPRPGTNVAPGEWKPDIQRKEVTPGIWREETQDEAWERCRSIVRHYSAIGYPAEVICRIMRPAVSDETLRKYFSFELENGRLIQDAKMAGTAFQLGVTGRDPAMTRFWIRSRMGWRDSGDAPSGPQEIRFKKIDGDDW